MYAIGVTAPPSESRCSILCTLLTLGVGTPEGTDAASVTVADALPEAIAGIVTCAEAPLLICPSEKLVGALPSVAVCELLGGKVGEAVGVGVEPPPPPPLGSAPPPPPPPPQAARDNTKTPTSKTDDFMTKGPYGKRVSDLSRQTDRATFKALSENRYPMRAR